MDQTPPSYRSSTPVFPLDVVAQSHHWQKPSSIVPRPVHEWNMHGVLGQANISTGKRFLQQDTGQNIERRRKRIRYREDISYIQEDPRCTSSNVAELQERSMSQMELAPETPEMPGFGTLLSTTGSSGLSEAYTSPRHYIPQDQQSTQLYLPYVAPYSLPDPLLYMTAMATANSAAHFEQAQSAPIVPAFDCGYLEYSTSPTHNLPQPPNITLTALNYNAQDFQSNSGYQYGHAQSLASSSTQHGIAPGLLVHPPSPKLVPWPLFPIFTTIDPIELFDASYAQQEPEGWWDI